MPNLKNSEIWTYLPDTAETLVAPSESNITLSAVSYTDESNQLDASKLFNANTAHVKAAKWGLTKDRRLKLSALSTAVALTGTLSSAQALQAVIASADAADRPLAYQLFVSHTGSTGTYYALPPVPVPAKFTRENTEMTEDLVVKIPSKLNWGIKDLFYTKALANDTAPAYGVQSDSLDFGYDDGGLKIEYGVESYDFNVNGSKTTVPYSGMLSTTLSVNPNTWDRKSKILPYLGYNLGADGHYVWGVPTEGLKSMILDMDGDFNESNPGRERILIYSLGIRPTDKSELSKEINGKKPFDLKFESIQTNFCHEVFLTTSTREAV